MLDSLDFWISAFVLGLLAWAKFGQQLRATWERLRPQSVNDYGDLMSRNAPAVVSPSGTSETRPPQTPDQTEDPADRKSVV